MYALWEGIRSAVFHGWSVSPEHPKPGAEFTSRPPHGWVDLTEMGGWSFSLLQMEGETVHFPCLPAPRATFPDAALVGRFSLDTREN